MIWQLSPLTLPKRHKTRMMRRVVLLYLTMITINYYLFFNYQYKAMAIDLFYCQFQIVVTSFQYGAGINNDWFITTYHIINHMDVSIKKQQSIGGAGLLNVKSAQNLQCDTGKSFLNTLASRNFEKYEVIVQNQHLQNQLKLIEWRSKTEFPIVKILFYKILQKKLLNQCSVLQLAIENFPCNLNSLPKMPFYQLLYLIKESLIGFERLFDRFGPFDITNKMILIGKNSKCRVWINENITLNFPSKRNKLTETQFLYKVANIFQEKCLKSTLSTQLFGTLRKYNKIVQAIQYVQTFIKVHRIVLPNKLNSITESLGSKKLLEKYEENIGKINQQHFGHDTLRKVPKFLTQLREEKRLQREKVDKSADSPKKENKSTDSPAKKAKDLIVNRDHSQKKVKTLIGMSPIKNKEVSIQKSDISPKSQISADINKQTKSFICKKYTVNTVKSLNNLLQKRKSEESLKLNYPLSPQVKANYITSEKTLKMEQIKQFADELFYTKLPSKPSPKPRKHSNNDFQKAFPKREFNINRFTSKEKCPDSVQSSQQTAATIEDHYPKKKVFQLAYAQNVQTNYYKLHQNTISKEQQSQQPTKQVFQRNGWIKRMNSLGYENIRETLESQHDGVQTFSQEYTMAKQNLAFLGSMGKELKGSIMQQD